MEIVWLGHSAVRVRSNEVTLITDPYADSLGISMGRQSANIVTVSHVHPHHAHVEAVGGSPRVVKGPGEYEVADFYIRAFGTRRGDKDGDREVNTIYIIQAEGLVLCHLGDLNQTLSPKQLEELGHADILLVPAGGVCTMAPAAMAELVNLINPGIVIPMHYWTEGVKVQLGPLDAFIKAMAAQGVSPQPRLNVTAASVPRGETRVVVLERAARPSA